MAVGGRKARGSGLAGHQGAAEEAKQRAKRASGLQEEKEVVEAVEAAGEGGGRWRRVQAGVGIRSAPTREYVRYYRREETEKERSDVRVVAKEGER